LKVENRTSAIVRECKPDFLKKKKLLQTLLRDVSKWFGQTKGKSFGERGRWGAFPVGVFESREKST